MKVAIVGSKGQLGHALISSAPDGIEVIALDRSQLDLTDPSSIEHVLDELRPAVVVNAAAYTAVDQAESDPATPFIVNGQAPGLLAGHCAAIDARLVHLSTDFVFDGERGSPYRPEDEPKPLNVYGASKLEGERRVAAVAGLNWSIVRTAWVYAPGSRRNFVSTMLRIFRERPLVKVVCDQIGTPTSAASLAKCVWRVATDSRGGFGILHYTDAGVASWYDFAVAIYEEALALGLLRDDVQVVPISSDEYPTPARRPAYSVLDKRSTLAQLHIAPLHWRGSLRAALQERTE